MDIEHRTSSIERRTGMEIIRIEVQIPKWLKITRVTDFPKGSTTGDTGWEFWNDALGGG